MSARVLLFLCALHSVYGCGGATGSGSSTRAAHGMEESSDPGFPSRTPDLYPFTAAELRASIRAGRRYFFRTERFFHRRMYEYHHVYGVAQATEDTVTTYVYPADEEGRGLLVPSPFQRTWEALAREIGLPADFTPAGEATLLTLAGDFECDVYAWRYEREEEEWESVYYFAKSLPGPAIKHAVHRNGELYFNSYVVALWP